MIPLPPGNASLSVTLLAVPPPLPLLTVTVKPIASPALTEVASAVLVTVTVGQFTVTEAVFDCAEPALLANTVALLFTVPHVAEVVGLVMWTLKLLLGASDDFVQVSTPPEMLQVGELVVPAIAQLVPALVGNVSVIETPLAVPAPVFVTVTTKPI